MAEIAGVELALRGSIRFVHWFSIIKAITSEGLLKSMGKEKATSCVIDLYSSQGRNVRVESQYNTAVAHATTVPL
jgi:hypothetical protein